MSVETLLVVYFLMGVAVGILAEIMKMRKRSMKIEPGCEKLRWIEEKEMEILNKFLPQNRVISPLS